MADIRIQYVNKSGDTHEHITDLGNDSGTSPVADVVAWIENRTHTFYVFENGRRADIYVRQGTNRKYVQTVADGEWQNNLVSLPPCKVRAA
jgi:hypothetical protein